MLLPHNWAIKCSDCCPCSILRMLLAGLLGGTSSFLYGCCLALMDGRCSTGLVVATIRLCGSRLLGVLTFWGRLLFHGIIRELKHWGRDWGHALNYAELWIKLCWIDALLALLNLLESCLIDFLLVYLIISSVKFWFNTECLTEILRHSNRSLILPISVFFFLEYPVWLISINQMIPNDIMMILYPPPHLSHHPCPIISSPSCVEQAVLWISLSHQHLPPFFPYLCLLTRLILPLVMI